MPSANVAMIHNLWLQASSPTVNSQLQNFGSLHPRNSGNTRSRHPAGYWEFRRAKDTTGVMEAHTILNSFVTAANQYAASQTEQNLHHLQRQLDIILGFCSPDQEFWNDPNQLFITDFYTALINILLDIEVKPALVQRVLSLLHNIVKNEAARHALRSMFHLHSALSVFLQNHGSGISMRDPLVMQCLQLLEVVTHGVSITVIESNMKNLLNSFIKLIIVNKTDEALLPVLRILANLCRHNPSVQSYMCSLPNMKEICKELVSKLCCLDSTIVIYVLSILASLSLNSDMGDKFFSAKQVWKTFQLIVNLLVAKDSDSQTAALDLFFDLIERKKVQPHFVRHPDLHSILQKVLNTCSTDALPDQVGGFWKFFLSFMEIPESQQIVLSVLCTEPMGSGDQISGTAIHPLLLESAGGTVDTRGDAPIFALRLIKHIIELLPRDKLQQIDGSIKDLLEVLITQLSTHLNFDSRLLMRQLQRDVALFDVILSMCKNSSLVNFICLHLDINKCHEIISLQLEHNPLSIKEQEWSEAGVDLVLLTIGVIISVKDYLGEAKDVLNILLKEPRLMPFIATSLRSSSKERVLRALHTIFVCTNVDQFPTKILGESIAATNNCRSQQNWGGPEPFTLNYEMESFQYSSVLPVNRAGSFYNRRQSIDRNVQNLIQKVETGLDLRELKSSEIMEMYEHKIAALCLKEQELQNFVHAKSVALQQADRLLNQYKCRQAQREAEALKIRSLLKESERRSEVAQEQSKKAIQKQLQLQKDLDKAHQDIATLEQYTDEQKEALTEQTEKFAAVQKNLENLQIEHHSVSEMHSMLQRHSETQKQKLDMLANNLAEMEKDKNNLIKQLKEKDSRLKDLGKQLQKTEETLKKKEISIRDLEESKEVLTKDAQKTEKRISKLEQEKSSFELLCQQHEASLEDKEARIKSLMEELERQTHLTDMIHEITSGKINKNSFASLLNKEK